MKLNNKVIKNYIYNTGYQVLALIVPLITTPYISRILGAEGIGIYSYTYSIVSYFTMCSILGTALYGKKQIGVLQDDPVERTKKFWDIFVFRLIAALFALILYIIFVVNYSNDKIIAFIQGFYIVGVITDVSWLFQGMEDFEKVAIRNFIFKFINVILIFVLIKDESDLWKYVFLLAIITVIGNISMWPFLSKYIIKLKDYVPQPFNDIKINIKLFVPAIATQLYSIIDKSMLGGITMDPNQNGYYEQSEKIVKMSLVLITSVATVLLPKVSKAYAEEKYDEIKEYLNGAYRFTWFMGIPLMCGVVAISPHLVPVFFGTGYEPVAQILPIMSLLFIFMATNQINCTLFFVSAEKEDKYLKYMLIGGIVNVGLNLFLIKYSGAIGAAIGTVIGEIVITILELTYIAKKRYLKFLELFRMGVKYCIAGLVMFIVLNYIVSLLEATAFSLFLLIVVGSITYFFALFLLKEKYVMTVINKYF